MMPKRVYVVRGWENLDSGHAPEGPAQETFWRFSAKTDKEAKKKMASATRVKRKELFRKVQ